MIFSRCYDYRVWFWGSSDDNIRFTDKLPILWLITRKILRQNVSKYFIGMFYVVSDRYSTEHRGWELNKKHTHLWYFFTKVTPENVKVTVDYPCTGSSSLSSSQLQSIQKKIHRSDFSRKYLILNLIGRRIQGKYNIVYT